MNIINNDTPIVQQYKDIKKLHKDKILFFHLGDFYEMFYEDAEIVSKTLGLTLTYRKNSNEKIYMCGIPIANKDFYIRKLLKESFKIAICEQIETTEECKKRGGKLVNRGITAIYTSGTYVDENSYDNNFILSITKDIYNNNLYLLYIDISTEEFFYEIIEENELLNSLKRIKPKEILISNMEQNINLYSYEEFITEITIPNNYTNEYIIKNFTICKKIEEFLLHENKEEFNILITLLFTHLQNTYNPFPTITPIMAINSIESSLDKYTIDNLNLFGDKSLYNLLNKNFTNEGKRLLKNIILKPLIHKNSIEERLNMVKFFNYHTIHKTLFFHNLKDKLQSIGDINKILFLINKNNYKIHYSTLNIFLNSLKTCEEIIHLLKLEDKLPIFLHKKIIKYEFLKEYKDLIKIFNNNENYFNEEYLNQLYIKNNISKIIGDLNEHLEEIKINIPNIKLTNNSIIGYFFEITHKDKHLLKEEFIIKQSLLNNIRFTTTKLVKLEGELKLIEMEKQDIIHKLLSEYLNKILIEKDQIKYLISIISWIDVFFSFGRISVENNYYPPKILEYNNNNIINFNNGRHPIIETIQNGFITNNIQLENTQQIIFITGPNMGGKSTFMRTTALIVLMAQIGSYVPAENLNITPFKNIFVRIGYNDDFVESESTFYKEMKECAYILNKCLDSRNIVFFDEICRGTSYNDGIILSKSIIKYLINKKISCLISSHYLELGLYFKNSYANEIINMFTDYKYENNNLIFLYKMVLGIIDDSFGIKVAEMAKLPDDIIKYAYELKLKNF